MILIEKRSLQLDKIQFYNQMLNRSEIDAPIWTAWNLNCQQFDLVALIKRLHFAGLYFIIKVMVRIVVEK